MRISCDMDDILCETAHTLCALAERMFGKRVAYEDIVSFNLQETFSLTDGEMARFMAAAHEYATILSYAPTPGAVEALTALRASGHEVEIVTGRPATSYRATEAWLGENGLGGFSVTYVNKYGRLFSNDGDAPEMVPMADFLKRHYDVAIDDSPMALTPLAAWNETRVFVFDRPWNRRFTPAANMIRVKDWAAIMKEIA